MQGHSDYYKSSMFSHIPVPRGGGDADTTTTTTTTTSKEGGEAASTDDYQLKPMNCPFHCAVYTSRPRSSAP